MPSVNQILFHLREAHELPDSVQHQTGVREGKGSGDPAQLRRIVEG